MAISVTSQILVCPPPQRRRPILPSPSSSTTPPLCWNRRKLRSRSDNRHLFGSGPQKLAVRSLLSQQPRLPAPPSGFAVEELADVPIFSASTGESALFKDLLDKNEGISVVALLRHFGCPCSWELASVLRDSKSTFDSAGVKLIAVGVGTPDKARILAERLSFPLDCLYADPDRKAYNILGLYYGLGRTFFNPASAKVFSRGDAYREVFKKYTVSATPDDTSSVFQQGGMFVFKGNQLLYARKDEGTGDHAPLDDVLNVCCKVPVV